jgi:hypothetical protein
MTHLKRVNQVRKLDSVPNKEHWHVISRTTKGINAVRRSLWSVRRIPSAKKAEGQSHLAGLNDAAPIKITATLLPNKIPVALFCVKLDRKSPRVAQGFRAMPTVDDSTEPNCNIGYLPNFAE